MEKRINLSKLPGISADFVSFRHRLQALMEADKIVDDMEKSGIDAVFYTEANYPSRLKHCDDAPLLLYFKGNMDWNPDKIVSIVGTRHASEYGKQLTQELVQGLAELGVTVVSGMAYGIDICAHLSAVKTSQPTWGVLGHGINWMYPSSHRRIADKMLENGGLISEFYPSLKPEPAHFPMRNRIVAGISDATIVVESGDKGGSLITAQMAFEYNKDVFAFPGDIHRPYSQGCLELIIQNKASLIRGSKDLIRAMNWDQQKIVSSQRSLFVELNAQEQKIVDALKQKHELSLDAIGYLAALNVSEVSTQLLNLEFKGMVRSLPGRRFQLI